MYPCTLNNQSPISRAIFVFNFYGLLICIWVSFAMDYYIDWLHNVIVSKVISGLAFGLWHPAHAARVAPLGFVVIDLK